MPYSITLKPKKTFKQLIKDGKYDYEFINSDHKPEKFVVGKVDIELLHLNKMLTDKEALNEIEKQGYRLATFQEALEFGKTYPGVQREFWLATFSQLWFLILGGGGVERSLIVNRKDLDGRWLARCRFLVVRKSSDTLSIGTSESLETLTLDEIRKLKEFSKLLS
jgi:hypothetical protein